MKVNSLFMYPSITKYQANFESTSSVINYDVSQRFLWSLTFMTIVLTVLIPPKLYIPSTIKIQMNLVPFLFLANWAVRAILKFSAIFLKYPIFEVIIVIFS